MVQKRKKDQGQRLTLTVRRRPGSPQQGIMRVAGRVFYCALGRSGVVNVKREGDGGTPRGSFRLLFVYRRGFLPRIRPGKLPSQAITAEDGWCDAVGDRNYNRPVRLPYPASHETMLRNDRLYDVVVVMDHNVTQRMKRGGSAIFFHIARPDYSPTEGCVAISPEAMGWILPRLGSDSRIVVL